MNSFPQTEEEVLELMEETDSTEIDLSEGEIEKLTSTLLVERVQNGLNFYTLSAEIRDEDYSTTQMQTLCQVCKDQKPMANLREARAFGYEFVCSECIDTYLETGEWPFEYREWLESIVSEHDEEILMVNEETQEIIFSAKDTSELLEKCQQIEYDSENALVIR